MFDTTIFAWFTPSFMHSHMVTSYRFLGGPIALHGLVHFLNTTGPPLTKVVSAYFDRSSYQFKHILVSKLHIAYVNSLPIWTPSNFHEQFKNTCVGHQIHRTLSLTSLEVPGGKRFFR